MQQSSVLVNGFAPRVKYQSLTMIKSWEALTFFVVYRDNSLAGIKNITKVYLKDGAEFVGYETMRSRVARYYADADMCTAHTVDYYFEVPVLNGQHRAKVYLSELLAQGIDIFIASEGYEFI